MCTLSGSLSLFATACGLYGVPDAVRSSFARRISVAAEGTDGGLITVADCANGRDTPAHIRIARDGRGWRAVSLTRTRVGRWDEAVVARPIVGGEGASPEAVEAAVWAVYAAALAAGERHANVVLFA